jgi:hypothetical protein
MEEMGGPSIVTVRRDDFPRWTAQMDGHTGSVRSWTEPRLQVDSPSRTTAGQIASYDQRRTAETRET